MKRVEISKFVGIVALGTSLIGAMTGPAAYAQNASPVNGNGSSARRMNAAPVATASVSLEPILERAASMMHAARIRMSDAPSGARASYATAASNFQRLFSVYGMNPANVSRSNSAAVSSYQIADDIRTLRAAAKSVRGTRASNLQSVASLYATGAKEFFTGQVRDALLGPNSLPPVVIRGDGRAARRSRVASANTGSSASYVQQYPEVPEQQGDPNTPTASSYGVIPPSVQYPDNSQVVTSGYPAYILPTEMIYPAGVNFGVYNFGNGANGSQAFSPGPGVILYPSYPYVANPNTILRFSGPYGFPFPY